MVLELQTKLSTDFKTQGLNPCLGGIWSWRGRKERFGSIREIVLILVWVEYGLGATHCS